MTFTAFWFLAALTMLVVGGAMFVAVRHAHRVGGLVGLLGIACLAIGLALRRAGRQSG